MNLINGKVKMVYGVGALFIITIYEIGLNYYIVPSVIFDEIGYWSSAAYFAGYDWSGILSYTSYYGYGMGFILAIFMKLIKNPILLYQVILQIQVLMVLGIYCISIKVLSILSAKKLCLSRVLISIITTCYPTMLMNAKLVWSECFIIFFSWLSLYFFIRYIEKQNSIYAICLGGTLGYLYMIHIRNIGSICLIIAFVLSVIYMKKGTKKNVNALCFIVIIGVILIAAYFIKSIVKENVFYTCGNMNEENSIVAANANDYSGRVSALIDSVLNYGLAGACYSFIGKLYYTAIGTLGFSIYFFIYMYRKIKVCIKNRNVDNESLIIIYVFLFFVGAFIINMLSTLAIGDGTRSDGLIYGRYMEHTFPMLILVGLYYFSTNNIQLKETLRVSVLILVIGIAIYNIYLSFKFGGWINICVPMVDWGHEKIEEFKWVLFYCTSVVGILVGCCIIKTKTRIKIYFYILICVTFLIVSKHTVGIVHNLQSSLRVNVEFTERVNVINFKVPIYCLKQENPYLYINACDVQFLLPDYKVSYISKEQINQFQGDYYLLVESLEDLNVSGLNNIYKTSFGWYVLVPENGELNNIVREKGF